MNLRVQCDCSVLFLEVQASSVELRDGCLRVVNAHFEQWRRSVDVSSRLEASLTLGCVARQLNAAKAVLPVSR